MRIGIGGLSCECCTFSPLPSTESDFHIVSGETLLAEYDSLGEIEDAEFVPLRGARAIPGGPIERKFYDDFKTSFLLEIMTGGTLDGLLLDMHGAASVIGIEDAEADFYSVIRTAVGPECMIAASYDLHGNLSREALQHLDFLTAYRTAPHVDRPKTLKRALDLLVRCIRREHRPTKAFIPIPILLPGEKTCTKFEPTKNLYGQLPSVIEKYDLIDASILIGYAWADEPRATASVVAFGGDTVNTQEAAATMARHFWDRRRGFGFGVYASSVDGCIDTAMRFKARPVIISDSGDNPTAGGAGDVPFVLERLIELKTARTLYASITDPAAVERCTQGGLDQKITVTLGGKLDPIHGKPLEVTGRVVATRDFAAAKDPQNNSAVIRIGGVDVIVIQRRTPFHSRDDFLRAGVDPNNYDVIVVKIGYLVPGLEEIAAESLLALSPGAVNQDFNSLAYQLINRPMFPFDRDMEWQPPRNSIV